MGSWHVGSSQAGGQNYALLAVVGAVGQVGLPEKVDNAELILALGIEGGAKEPAGLNFTTRLGDGVSDKTGREDCWQQFRDSR